MKCEPSRKELGKGDGFRVVIPFSWDEEKKAQGEFKWLVDHNKAREYILCSVVDDPLDDEEIGI